MAGQIIFNFSDKTGPLMVNVTVQKGGQNIAVSPFVPVESQSAALETLRQFLDEFGLEIIAKVVPEPETHEIGGE